MSRNIVVSVVSLILVVSVAIDVVVVVADDVDVDVDVAPVTQPSQKMAGVICNNAGGDDQKFCEETLQNVTGLDADNPKAHIEALVQATIDSIIKGMNMSDQVIAEHKNNENIEMGVNCYKRNLNESMKSIKRCMEMVQNNNMQQVVDQYADFRSWLSASFSSLSMCSDCFDTLTTTAEEDQIFEQLQSATLYFVKKFTGMTLNIVTGLPQISEQLMPLT